MEVPPCNDCDGRCCRWVFFPYDEPQEQITLWRGGKVVVIDGVKTYFAFNIACEMQCQNGRCRIYRLRDKICKERGNDEFCIITKALEKHLKGLPKIRQP
jgi:hypothetical protein